MRTITVKLDEALVAQVDSLVGTTETNRSEIIRRALSEYVSDIHSQYEGIPKSIKDKMAFLKLLVLEGTPENDWSIVQREVTSIWTDML